MLIKLNVIRRQRACELESNRQFAEAGHFGVEEESVGQPLAASHLDLNRFPGADGPLESHIVHSGDHWHSIIAGFDFASQQDGSGL